MGQHLDGDVNAFGETPFRHTLARAKQRAINLNNDVARWVVLILADRGELHKIDR